MVEYNPLISAIFKCNTNVSILGSYSQAKALQMYLLKYITKAPDDLTASITILKNARIRMDHFPSQAEDAGTDERSAIRYLQGVANMMVGASEYSAATAAYGILDYPPEVYTTLFWYVYVHDALNYVQRQKRARIPNSQQVTSEHSYASSEEQPTTEAAAASRSTCRRQRTGNSAENMENTLMRICSAFSTDGRDDEGIDYAEINDHIEDDSDPDDFNFNPHPGFQMNLELRLMSHGYALTELQLLLYTKQKKARNLFRKSFTMLIVEKTWLITVYTNTLPLLM